MPRWLAAERYHLLRRAFRATCRLIQLVLHRTLPCLEITFEVVELHSLTAKKAVAIVALEFPPFVAAQDFPPVNAQQTSPDRERLRKELCRPCHRGRELHRHVEEAAPLAVEQHLILRERRLKRDVHWLCGLWWPLWLCRFLFG